MDAEEKVGCVASRSFLTNSKGALKEERVLER